MDLIYFIIPLFLIDLIIMFFYFIIQILKNNFVYLNIYVYIYFNKIFQCLFFFKYFDNFSSMKNKIIRKKLIFVDANS